ncbi:MAG: hypothetical protein ACQ9IQ_13815 [Nitrospirales bacterium]
MAKATSSASTQQWLVSVLDNRQAKTRRDSRSKGLFVQKEGYRIWQLPLSGCQDYYTPLWSLLMFQAWHEESIQ